MCIKLNNHTFSDPCVVFLMFLKFFIPFIFLYMDTVYADTSRKARASLRMQQCSSSDEIEVTSGADI